MNPPVRLLFGDTCVGLVKVERRTFDSKGLARISVVKHDFDVLRAEIDAEYRRHGCLQFRCRRLIGIL